MDFVDDSFDGWPSSLFLGRKLERAVMSVSREKRREWDSYGLCIKVRDDT